MSAKGTPSKKNDIRNYFSPPAANVKASPAANVKASPAANVKASPAANAKASPAANAKASPAKKEAKEPVEVVDVESDSEQEEEVEGSGDESSGDSSGSGSSEESEDGSDDDGAPDDFPSEKDVSKPAEKKEEAPKPPRKRRSTADDQSFPVAKLRTIMKSVPSMESISVESVAVVNKATEMFTRFLCSKGFDETLLRNAKTLEYDDLASLVKKNKRLMWIQDVLPERITYAEYLARPIVDEDYEVM